MSMVRPSKAFLSRTMRSCARHHREASTPRWLSSKSQGYQSIGSFHSDNVEQMMRERDYTPPVLPFESLPMTDEFLLNRKVWTFLNHGAFGASLKCGYDRAQQWRHHLEEQPLRFFDRDLLPHLTYGARRLADFTNADREGLALIPNATSGLNAAIRGYVEEFKGDAKILLWDVTYGSVKKMSRAYCDNVIEIPFQEKLMSGVDDEDLFLEALEDTLGGDDDWTNTLFVVDQTTSNTALNLPIERLCERCKEAGMITLVDGAHGLLTQDVDFEKMHSVDIYVSNGHKWLSCPRGVAFVYSPHEEIRESLLRLPAVVSHGVDDGYLSRFLWDGTRDYAAQLSLPVVLDFWEQADPTLIRSWLRSKLTDAIRLIAETWHPMYANDVEGWTGNVTLGNMAMHSPMALVKLPPILCGSASDPKSSANAKSVQDFLHDHKIEVPIKCINGVLYVRLSCHIYNDLKEYDRLAQVMLEYPR